MDGTGGDGAFPGSVITCDGGHNARTFTVDSGTLAILSASLVRPNEVPEYYGSVLTFAHDVRVVMDKGGFDFCDGESRVTIDVGDDGGWGERVRLPSTKATGAPWLVTDAVVEVVEPKPVQRTPKPVQSRQGMPTRASSRRGAA